MADVLIVCVREDETLAKAFADMFERAGLHVGGAPGAPEDMRHCGAALVVWSQASIRSRAFLDAAQRAVNAGKAVVACLIAPPPPASINHAPAFDLSRWTGDPDDPVLDPLFFSVDRMVAAARAAAGVPAGAAAREAPPAYAPQAQAAPAQSAPPYARARAAAPAAAPPTQPLRAAPPRNPSAYDATLRTPPPAYDPPPAPRAPNAGRRAAAPPAAPQRRPEPARGQDAVAAEAQNWAAIRHSRDPEDFLRHLADFGEDGAFAELAQMKLAELEAEARRRSKSSAQAARQSTQGGPPVRLDPPRAPQPAPQARGPAPRQARPQQPRTPSLTDYAQPPAPRGGPPPAAFEPIRNERPPARQQPRREPAPQAWRDGGRDERYVERRPPPAAPRAGGGALRLVVLIAILGAGALAAGLFAGDRLGGLGLLGPSSQTASGPGDDWETAEGTGAGSVGAEDARDVASASIDPPESLGPATQESRANRGGPEPVADSAPTPRTAPPEPPRERPQPQPAAATVSTTAPASGSPSEAFTAPPITAPPQELTTLAPPPTEEQMRSASVEPPRRATPPAPPPRAPQVVWASRPSASRVNDFFPQRALRQDRGGRVELDCLLDAGGVPRCAVARETPAGFGFGSAAIRASSQFRAAPTLDDGTPSAGAQTRLTIVFQAPNR